MNALRPLRLRLAVGAFAAMYLPVLLLLVVAIITGEDVNVDHQDGAAEPGTVTTIERGSAPSGWVVATAVVLAPATASLAWWWSARALRPLARSMALQAQLIEEASHELRTPLSVLTTNADVLLAHPEPTVDLLRDGLDRSRATARRMARTIDSLLVDARGRARTIELRPTDVAALARSAAAGLTPLAEEHGLTLQLDAPRPAPAPIDATSVERAIVNLIGNAIEHGAVAEVRISVERADGVVAVTVSDDGPGVPADDQTRIFDRFWRSRSGTTAGTNGSGLGLSIVRQVALAHGGAVTLTSPLVDGRGSRFVLTLRSP